MLLEEWQEQGSWHSSGQQPLALGCSPGLACAQRWPVPGPDQAARAAPAAFSWKSPSCWLVGIQVGAEGCVVELVLHTCSCCYIGQVSPRGPVWCYMWLLLQGSTSIFNSWVTQALLVVESRPVATCQALDEVCAWCCVYSDTT